MKGKTFYCNLGYMMFSNLRKYCPFETEDDLYFCVLISKHSIVRMNFIEKSFHYFFLGSTENNFSNFTIALH